MKSSYLAKIINCKLAELDRASVLDDSLKCRCGGDVMVIARQTRKSDEGMTVFYKCSKCDFTKKKN